MHCSSKIPLAMRGVFFILLIAFTTVASAESGVDLGSIAVEGALPAAEPSRDSTAASSVVVPSENPNPAATIPDLIEETAGVHIKRYGRIDDFSAISLRGSGAGQVQIYLDDIPLATSQGEFVDFSMIPIAAIDRIEVYRGGSPGSISDATAGGVILLRTKDTGVKDETILKQTGASFATYKGSVARTGSFKKISYIAAYERFQSEGSFDYVDNNGTRFNTADDVVRERTNNSFASNSLFTKVGSDISGDWHLSATNLFFQKGQGVPGLGGLQSNEANLTSWRDLVMIAADGKIPSVEKLQLHISSFFDYGKSRFIDAGGEIGLGTQRNDDDTFRFGGELRSEYLMGQHQRITGFLAERSELFLPENYDASPQAGAWNKRHEVTIGAEDEIRLFGDRLAIVPSLRLTNLWSDLANDDPSMRYAAYVSQKRSDHNLSAKVGVIFEMMDGLNLKGNFYRGFRNPTFAEMFGDRGSIVGNPNLSPEEAINFDLGAAYALKISKPNVKLNLEANYFRNRVSNLIQFLQTSQFTVRAENMSDALIHGAEFSARVALSDRFTGYSSYTFQDAKNVSDGSATFGKKLPGRPAHQLGSGISWMEEWLPNFSTRAFADLNYMSGNYLDSQNLMSVENRTLISAGLTTTLAKRLSLTFSVQNISDDRISDVVGYPLPGRSYWGTLELKI